MMRVHCVVESPAYTIREHIQALSTTDSTTCRIDLGALSASRARHSAHHDEVGLGFGGKQNKMDDKESG